MVLPTIEAMMVNFKKLHEQLTMIQQLKLESQLEVVYNVAITTMKDYEEEIFAFGELHGVSSTNCNTGKMRSTFDVIADINKLGYK